MKTLTNNIINLLGTGSSKKLISAVAYTSLKVITLGTVLTIVNFFM